MKRCPKCGEAKPLTAFSIRKSGRVGHAVAHCTECRVTAQRENRKKNPVAYERIERKSKYKRNYGITLDLYDELFKQQDGRCAICQTDKPDDWHKHFSVDHCHKTGRIRGLLCGNCNNGLGRFRDDTSLLLKAAEYLLEN